MQVEVLNQLLEEELAQAVEVKDPKSLRRWVMILTSSFAQRTEQEDARRESDSRFQETNANFDKTIAVMKERFEAVDKRFEMVDRRFEMVDKRFEIVDKRFDDVNKRFDSMQWLLGIGFTILATMMTLYQFLHT